MSTSKNYLGHSPILLLLFLSFSQWVFAGYQLPIDPQLSESEKAGLRQMREEEKLAHDVYSYLYDKWQINAFSNIAQSEKRHSSMIGSLIDQYGIDDPVQLEKGQFSDQNIQKLYDDLTAKGSKSLEDALIVGATIEDLDIADLDQLITNTKNEDIKFVYNKLIRASGNHIRTFNSLLDPYNTKYQPVHLSQERYDQILSVSQERGNKKAGPGNKNKDTKGRKKGKGQKTCKGKQGRQNSNCTGNSTRQANCRR